MWFSQNNAEEAINYYVDVFKNNPAGSKGETKVIEISKYPENAEGPMKGFEGKVLNGNFMLDGVQFLALDGGPGVF